MNRSSSPSLTELLIPYFERRVRARGEEYAQDGLVIDVRIALTSASARVLGGQVYSVSFDWSKRPKGPISATCTCAHFLEGEYCKHLWAFALTIEPDVTLAPGPAGANRVVRARSSISGKSAKPSATAVEVSSDEPGEPYAEREMRDGTREDLSAANKSNLVTRSWRERLARPKARAGAGSTGGDRRLVSHLVGRLKIYFVLQAATARNQNQDRLAIRYFGKEKGGEVRPLSIFNRSKIEAADLESQSLLQALLTLAAGELAAQNRHARGSEWLYQDPTQCNLHIETLRLLLPKLLASKRVFASVEDLHQALASETAWSAHREFDSGLQATAQPLNYQSWHRLSLQVEDRGEEYVLRGLLHASDPSAGQSLATANITSDLSLLASPGLYRVGSSVGFVELVESEQNWFDELRADELRVPVDDAEAFLEAVFDSGLECELPPSLQWPKQTLNPTARVNLSREGTPGSFRFNVDLLFQYDKREVSYFDPRAQLPDGETRSIYLRDLAHERKTFDLLPQDLWSWARLEGTPLVHGSVLRDFVARLLERGLPVQVNQRRVSESGSLSMTVISGIDWFDVQGEVNFEGRWVRYPAILEAIRRGESFVPLADGDIGLISEELKERLARMDSFAQSHPDGFRFTSAQGILLDSLLEDSEHLVFDDKFAELRAKIKTFSGIRRAEPTDSFAGRLRDYQREGLGWLLFLEEFGLGGILADDMGLGKTVQCLAYLDHRLARRASRSLLIAPKTLLENWRAEAQRFTPKLRVLVHAGIQRYQNAQSLNDYDLIVTTYQTMLRDLDLFRPVEWDCLILDEAQIIKNPQAQVAKAVKLMSARFRLALTGTPVENSLNDLFSISDFVNPGFVRAQSRRAGPQPGEKFRQVLAKAFQPIVLRRTKEQVLRELPEKTEQVITVNLEAKQLKVYNELKRFYQSQLLPEVRENGVRHSQIQILAALTRLRQAALHPGLIDSELAGVRSAKFEALLEMLDEILAEGHRVLIFSQFTSLLKLLTRQLKEKGINYFYLDGKTRERQEVVDAFKQSTDGVFLISLKAGGLGLNLVEADYVFLLDPWWNPAVEAQAIDRAHRIGQMRPVNAYRIIAKNTVEEKIIELQKTKRGLVADLFGKKNSLIGELSATDLANLFA